MTVSDSTDAGASSPTILVVDDDTPLRGLVTRILDQSGYQVIAASDGREALDTIIGQELRPDLVLTDVVMPYLSGPELAQCILEIHPEMPIIFMSGYIGRLSAYGERILDEHVLIQKPFLPDELVTKIRSLLEAGRETG